MRIRFSWLGRLVVAAVLVSSCGGTLVTSSAATVTFTGRLGGGLSSGPDPVDCSWLQDDAGRRVEVIYPERWDLRFRPLEVVDPAGRVFARAGDELRVTGPGGGIGGSICSTGLPFVAVTVEKTRSASPGGS
jgi:hypothetical protein